jgi:hypothetical protein
MQPLIWEGMGRLVPVRGYVERWAATPWETLEVNHLDRCSLLKDLAAEGALITKGVLAMVMSALRQQVPATDPAGVVPFDCPVLHIRAIGA